MINKQELVSVIIPAYNLESYIERSLRSVLEQTYENIEIIVVNDGSKDKTAQVAEKILKNAGKIYKIINQKNQGASVARNTGLTAAQGKYIKFLDGDDTLFPWTVEELVGAIEENKCDIAFGGQNVVNLKGKILYRYDEMYEYTQGVYESKEILKKFLLQTMHISLNSSIFLKEIIDKNFIKFTPGTRYSEDNEFISKYLYYSGSGYVFNKAVANALYRIKSTTKIPSLSVFHNVGAMLRLKRFFEERREREIAKIIESECIPAAYTWTIGNLAFNGYPLFDWLRIARMDKVRRNVISYKIHNKNTKFGKQQNFLISLFRFSPFLVYVLLRSYSYILKILHR